MQQGDSGLVGFGFCQFEQSADLKSVSVARVGPLTTTCHMGTDDITSDQIILKLSNSSPTENSLFMSKIFLLLLNTHVLNTTFSQSTSESTFQSSSGQ